ncbi:hypothetical protein MCEMIEM13_03227 [Comamonadaceae bacterium]
MSVTLARCAGVRVSRSALRAPTWKEKKCTPSKSHNAESAEKSMERLASFLWVGLPAQTMPTRSLPCISGFWKWGSHVALRA